MRIIKNIDAMIAISKKMRLEGKSIGFVPTMGALHSGHLSLIRKARKDNDFLVVSIFVNPKQFGPKEDFKKYPRQIKQDADFCSKEKVDVIFSPEVKSIYKENHKTYIDIRDLSGVLCGKFRPGHFKGVATMVNKLFNIINPTIAYFGQKDAQQSIVIKRMVQDLNMPVKVMVLPTVRESDGLAMSSRNLYLNKIQRRNTVVLYQALIEAKKLIKQGILDSSIIIRKMKQLLSKKKSLRIQYIEIVDPDNLNPLSRIKGKALVALAAWVGKTRLIDNIIINN